MYLDRQNYINFKRFLQIKKIPATCTRHVSKQSQGLFSSIAQRDRVYFFYFTSRHLILKIITGRNEFVFLTRREDMAN